LREAWTIVLSARIPGPILTPQAFAQQRGRAPCAENSVDQSPETGAGPLPSFTESCNSGALYALVLWVAWLLAVRMTAPKHAVATRL
jgi:hypothetical protein